MKTSIPKNPATKQEKLASFMAMTPAEQAADLKQRHDAIAASADDKSTSYLDRLAAEQIDTTAGRWFDKAEAKAGIV